MTIETPSPADIENLALARRSGWPDICACWSRVTRASNGGPRQSRRDGALLAVAPRHVPRTRRHDPNDPDAIPRGRAAAGEFPRQLVPRLQFLLSQLDVHHQIEDLHYFPIFRAAEARLARGFDVLEGDHHAIHADMAATAETANALLRALAGRPTRCAAAATTMRARAAR